MKIFFKLSSLFIYYFFGQRGGQKIKILFLLNDFVEIRRVRNISIGGRERERFLFFWRRDRSIDSDMDTFSMDRYRTRKEADLYRYRGRVLLFFHFFYFFCGFVVVSRRRSSLAHSTTLIRFHFICASDLHWRSARNLFLLFFFFFFALSNPSVTDAQTMRLALMRLNHGIPFPFSVSFSSVDVRVGVCVTCLQLSSTTLWNSLWEMATLLYPGQP